MADMMTKVKHATARVIVGLVFLPLAVFIIIPIALLIGIVYGIVDIAVGIILNRRSVTGRFALLNAYHVNLMMWIEANFKFVLGDAYRVVLTPKLAFIPQTEVYVR